MSDTNIHIDIKLLIRLDDLAELVQQEIRTKQESIPIARGDIQGEARVLPGMTFSAGSRAHIASRVPVAFELEKHIAFVKVRVNGVVRLHLRHLLQLEEDQFQIHSELRQIEWVEAAKANITGLKFSVSGIAEEGLQTQLPALLNSVDDHLRAQLTTIIKDPGPIQDKLLDNIKKRLGKHELELDKSGLITKFRDMYIESDSIILLLRVLYPSHVSIKVHLDQHTLDELL